MEIKNKLDRKRVSKKFSLFLIIVFTISLTSAFIFCIDHTNPSAPSNLILMESNGDVQLNWGSAVDIPSCSGIDHYDIYRSFNYGNFDLITSVVGTTYDDLSLSSGNYTYIIHSVDKAGHRERNGVSETITFEVEEPIKIYVSLDGENWIESNVAPDVVLSGGETYTFYVKTKNMISTQITGFVRTNITNPLGIGCNEFTSILVTSEGFTIDIFSEGLCIQDDINTIHFNHKTTPEIWVVDQSIINKVDATFHLAAYGDYEFTTYIVY